MTTFSDAHLTGVTINLKQKQITISAAIPLDDDNMELAQELEPYLDKDHDDVELSIAPYQRELPGMSTKEKPDDGS